MTAQNIYIQFAPGLMNREYAAFYLGQLSLRELDALREQREITPVGTGKRVRYAKADLDEYIARQPERPSSRGEA